MTTNIAVVPHASPFRLEVMVRQESLKESNRSRAGTSLSLAGIWWLTTRSANETIRRPGSSACDAIRANKARSIASSWLILDVSGGACYARGSLSSEPAFHVGQSQWVVRCFTPARIFCKLKL